MTIRSGEDETVAAAWTRVRVGLSSHQNCLLKLGNVDDVKMNSMLLEILCCDSTIAIRLEVRVVKVVTSNVLASS